MMTLAGKGIGDVVASIFAVCTAKLVRRTAADNERALSDTHAPCQAARGGLNRKSRLHVTKARDFTKDKGTAKTRVRAGDTDEEYDRKKMTTREKSRRESDPKAEGRRREKSEKRRERKEN